MPVEGRSQTLVAADQRDAQTTSLPLIQVRGQRDGTSEGSGAYTSPKITFGGKVPVDVLDIPNSVSVITRQRIDDQNLVTVDDALREVPGVTVSPWDGATTQMRSRGYEMEASYDGIPAYGALSAYQQFGLAIYDRLEVLRGPGGIFQGSSQPGGVVNFVRKRGRESFGGYLTASAGSWSNYRGEVDVGGPLMADGNLRNRLVASMQDRNYFYDTADSKNHLLYGTLDYDLGPNTTLSLTAIEQKDHVMPYMGQPAYTDQRFLDVPRSTYVYPDWVIQEWGKHSISLDLEHAFASGWSVKARVGRQTLDWYFKDAFPNPGEGVDPATGLVDSYARRRVDIQQERLGLDVFAAGPFSLWGREHEALIGLNWEQYETERQHAWGDDAFNVPISNPDVVDNIPIAYRTGYHSITRQGGLYGQLRLALTDRLSGVIGGRWSNFVEKNRTVDPQPTSAWTDGSKVHGEFTPYAGLIYHFTDDFSVYGSYSDTFMPQTAQKASGEWIAPRVGKQFEFGAKARLFDDALTLSAAVFQSRDVNRAYPDLDNPGFSLAAGKVKVQGWEVEASGRLFTNLDLTAGYTNLRTSYVVHQSIEAGTPFSLYEPKHSFKLFANYRFSQGPLARLSIGGGLHVSSGTLGNGVAGVREQKGYAVVNLQAGYQITKDARISVAINNLFDRNYYARVGGLNTYNTPGEPRSILVTMRYQLSPWVSD